jgi:hypothetical protein
MKVIFTLLMFTLLAQAAPAQDERIKKDKAPRRVNPVHVPVDTTHPPAIPVRHRDIPDPDDNMGIDTTSTEKKH